MLYESMYVGSFIYQWGYADCVNRRSPVGRLIANQQNPLDSLLGDLFSEVDGRFFLIEFKPKFKGFNKEVSGAKAKPARVALSNAFDPVGRLLELSRYGHFGCWSENNELKLNSYPWCINDGHPPIFSRIGNNLDFNGFYDLINMQNDAVVVNPGLITNGTFLEGLGLPAKSMIEYLKAVCQANPNVNNASAQTSLVLLGGAYANNQTTLVHASFDGLMTSFVSFGKHVANLPASKPTIR
jgi:hypothetical protein